ncbi:MAG: hypothetical protein IJF40_04550 [Clostridia bacterium]|nr:hypothetical protein [Clostridia bacterium]MBQ7046781.1 hypothetical protein [Oscillospiraceae bacterium]
MGGDVFFKTMTFGGFNKNDVLEYIGNQQEQLVAAEKKLKENEARLADALKNAESYKTMLAQQQNKAEEFFALSEEYAKKIFELEDEVNELNSKLSSIEVGCERAKDVEGQIGALVLDALLYSDKIIQSAKASAKGISSDTRRTIAEAASGVDEIGEDITQISDNFGEVVASLVSKINSLSTNLTSVADKLDSEEERIDKEQFTFGENGEVHLPFLDEGHFGLSGEGIDISDDDIRNLVNMLESNSKIDEPVSEILDSLKDEDKEEISEDDVSKTVETQTLSEEEIAEMTRKFLEGTE